MNKLFLLGQVLSFTGATFLLFSIFSKNKKKMITLISLTCTFCALSNLVLGGYSGFIANSSMAIRHILEVTGKLTKTITFAICIVIILFGLYFNKNSWIGILPIIASVSLIILTYYVKSVQNMRAVLMLSVFLWGIFDFHIKAYPAFITDVSTFLTSAFAYIKNINGNKEVAVS
ncbi:MAG: YgjV family protein [Bdellovibrionota bacterium]|jgi:hypothetical protein